jgi:16S rRNA U516 pseudouridylate synthase RsuA-like enzyme
MLEAAGCNVIALRRAREGPLTLEGLPEGQVRPLTAAEIVALKA